MDMDLRQLTTGEAASLCGVKPDTVLKWVKSGKLPARRTAGGHHRIDFHDLEAYTRSAGKLFVHAGEGGSAPHALRCWEYLSDRGRVREECLRCIVYQVRAAMCFEMLGVGGGNSHARQFCQMSCEDCVYYQRVRGFEAKVLIVSSDEQMLGALSSQECEGLSLHFARNAYEASTLIPVVRPAFVVVDKSLSPSGWGELVDCLAQDSRVPGLKILLAAMHIASADRTRLLERGVADVVAKPVSLDAIRAAIGKFPVESSGRDPVTIADLPPARRMV